MKSEHRTGKTEKGAVKKMGTTDSLNGNGWVRIEKIRLRKLRTTSQTGKVRLKKGKTDSLNRNNWIKIGKVWLKTARTTEPKHGRLHPKKGKIDSRLNQNMESPIEKYSRSDSNKQDLVDSLQPS